MRLCEAKGALTHDCFKSWCQTGLHCINMPSKIRGELPTGALHDAEQNARGWDNSFLIRRHAEPVNT